MVGGEFFILNETFPALRISGLTVKCYVGIEPEVERYKACDLSRGMRTCYIKYDMCKSIRSAISLSSSSSLFLVGEVVARGCSSKEKMFREHCEIHEMDDIMERFCYCSFNWCNGSPYLKVGNTKMKR